MANMSMDISAALARSKIHLDGSESEIVCSNMQDDIAPLVASERLRIIPIWTMEGDAEGQMYAEYRKNHAQYDAIFVRSELATRLAEAAKSLPAGIRLVVHAGHRPLVIQRKLLAEYAQDFRQMHPESTVSEALAHARHYVTDPDLRLPPHCCAAAVDVQLFDDTKNDFVDMGGKINLGSELSHLHTSHVTPAQYANRMLLLGAMLGAGFASFPTEWWHFSYGDQVWAWFYGRERSLYGIVDVDRE